MFISDCCGVPVHCQDICPRCGEHCESAGDEGYEAAVDAYNMGFGPPVTRRQRWEEQMEADEYRRNGW